MTTQAEMEAVADEVISGLMKMLRIVVRDEVRKELKAIQEADPLKAVGAKGLPLVYFIRSESGPIKIGVAENPGKRLGELQAASPSPLELLAVEKGGLDRERRYHAQFAEWRLHGEWFEPCEALLDLIAVLQSNAPPTRLDRLSVNGARPEGAYRNGGSNDQ